ncbi:MAG: response regulator transcription factor [Chloroflexi bacterium]|nr:response regulator transcription factor [Chloroflexota bacterium]
MAGKGQWRVLVVDDHAIFRETVRQVLAADSQFVVVAEAGSGEEAVALARQISVDLVLMDMRLPGMNGLSAAGVIKASQPWATILMLSGDWSPAYERKARAAGIHARLAKQSFSLSEIHRVLGSVSDLTGF